MRKSPLPPDFRTREAVSERLRELRPALEAQGLRHTAVFGSVARGDDVPESDVDVLVDLDPDNRIGLFQLVAIQQFFEASLGRRVDVETRASIRPGRHDEILADLFEVF